MGQIETGNGEAALDKAARAYRPDLILVDIRLPGIDGITWKFGDSILIFIANHLAWAKKPCHLQSSGKAEISMLSPNFCCEVRHRPLPPSVSC